MPDSTFSFNVGSARFQAYNVLLLELQFGRILNRDDAFRGRDVSREHVEQCRFSGAGTAGDQDVELALDHGGKQLQHGFGQGFVLDHVASGERITTETTNREARAIDGKGRNDGVDAGAVLQSGIDHGRGFVHPASDAGNDAIDDLHQVSVILEREPG